MINGKAKLIQLLPDLKNHSTSSKISIYKWNNFDPNDLSHHGISILIVLLRIN